jgi:hypothetical protein
MDAPSRVCVSTHPHVTTARTVLSGGGAGSGMGAGPFRLDEEAEAEAEEEDEPNVTTSSANRSTMALADGWVYVRVCELGRQARMTRDG